MTDGSEVCERHGEGMTPPKEKSGRPFLPSLSLSLCHASPIILFVHKMEA